MKKFIFLNLILWTCFGSLFGQCPSPAGSSLSNPYNVGTLSDGIPFIHTWNNTPGNCFVNSMEGPSVEIYYKFSIDSTLIVDISHVGSTITASQFYILDTYGSIIDYSNTYDPDYEWEAPSMQYTLPAGTYYIMSEGSSYGFLGNITTRISADVKRGKDLVKPIEVGTLVPGVPFLDFQSNDPDNGFGNTIGLASDDIFYRFTVPYSTDVSISTCDSYIGTHLMLLDSTGVQIAENDGNGVICNDDKASLRMPLAAGTYYAVVESSSPFDWGNISINIGIDKRYGTSAAYPVYAGIVEVGLPYSGTFNNSVEQSYGDSIGQPSDDIYHKFVLARKGTVSISHCGSQIDTYMHLLDANLNSIAVNNNDGPLCMGNNASIKQVLESGVYYVVSEGNGSIGGGINLQISMELFMESGISKNNNSIVTRLPLKSIQDTTVLNSLTSNKEKVRTTVQYFDGFGRALQTVQLRGSPSGQDLVQPVVYDLRGRMAQQFLPFMASDSLEGNYRPSAVSLNNIYNGSQQQLFYQNSINQGITSTSHPYSLTVFDSSPLNRVIQQGAPGAAWQPEGTLGAVSAGHTLKKAYGSNSAASGDYSVRLFKTTSSSQSGHARTLVNDGFYPAGELYLNISKDENWTAGKAGTIEEYKDKDGRVILKRIWENEITALSTYYVYDDFGNLSFVLPPGTTPDVALPQETVLDNYAYRYHYDHKKRLIEKKIPGKGWEYLVYNKLDRLILSQDSMQRAVNRWIFSKYDALGRAVMSGLAMIPGDREQVQSAADAHVVLWETFDSNNMVTGYQDTTRSYPASGSIVHYLTMNYYDSYNFPGASLMAAQGPFSNMTQGLSTASRIFTTDGTASYLSVNYYDQEGRIIESINQNHLGGTDRTVNSYNFTNELLSSTRTHVANGQTTIIGKNFTYDHMGRKLQQEQYVNEPDSSVIVSKNIYNAIGQLWKKKLHSINGGADFLENVDYSYNSRGWLKSQNSSHFNMELKYEDAINGVLPQYNGNISNQVFTNGGSNTFNYSYDKLNRLTRGEVSATNMSEVLTYDMMGNITSLDRDSTGANNYHYIGNRLQRVDNVTSMDYQYDGNGNAITDGRNGMSLKYNYLNLPDTATKSGTSVSYLYDGLGNKLRKISTINGNTTTRHYLNGIEYEGTAIEIIHMEEGLVRRHGNSYGYEYNLKDHLGNVRTTFYRNLITELSETLQRDNYYAFGMRKVVSGGTNKYLYNGKELQEELGQLDYGARFNDPIIGRFTTIDPHAEKYLSWTPYNYVANNPINLIDPDGRDWYRHKGEVKWFDDDAKSFKDEDGNKWRNAGTEFLEFDGKQLTYSWQTKDKEGNRKVNSISFQATSGKGDDVSNGWNVEREFDFSSDRQEMANIGPTPEGLYSLSKSPYSENNKSGYQSYDDLSPVQKLLSTVGRGLWPGGENSWGEHRWGLQKEQVNSSRKDMYLHGGLIWGSRGCIDCGQGISRFFNTFMKNNLGNDKVYLKVTYPNGLKYRLYNLPAN